jgi:hypothetical protein
MDSLRIKTFVVLILFVLTVAAVVGNVLLRETSLIVPLEKQEISGEELNAKFLLSLKNFGLNDEWIRKVKKLKNDPDSLLFTYRVDVPKDLPIPLLIKEINILLEKDSVLTDIKEKKIAGRTVINISSGSDLKLRAEVDYKDKISRSAGTIGILLDGISKLEPAYAKEILLQPEIFAVIMIPSKFSASYIDTVISNSKEFVLLLNDEITELDYKFSAKYSEKRLKSSMEKLVKSFKQAVCFLIDDTAELYSSSVYKFIDNHIQKSKLKYRKKSELLFLTGSTEEVASKLRTAALAERLNEPRLVVIPAAEYMNLMDTIMELRKLGCKFINPSEIISAK